MLPTLRENYLLFKIFEPDQKGLNRIWHPESPRNAKYAFESVTIIKEIGQTHLEILEDNSTKVLYSETKSVNKKKCTDGGKIKTSHKALDK